MTRPSDDALRSKLVERGVDYVCQFGLADLSLRPLAKAIGTSASLLLYHFGSKDELIMEIIKAGRDRQTGMMAALDLDGVSDREATRKIWKVLSSPKWAALWRLFFEVYVLALQDEERFPGFLESAVNDWLSALAPGAKSAYDYARATVMLAAFRGFILDFAATGDRKRLDCAVDLFIDMYEDS